MHHQDKFHMAISCKLGLVSYLAQSSIGRSDRTLRHLLTHKFQALIRKFEWDIQELQGLNVRRCQPDLLRCIPSSVPTLTCKSLYRISPLLYLFYTSLVPVLYSFPTRLSSNYSNATQRTSVSYAMRSNLPSSRKSIYLPISSL